jgi:hypothetical protein
MEKRTHSCEMYLELFIRDNRKTDLDRRTTAVQAAPISCPVDPPKHMLSGLFFGVLSLSFIFRSVCCATKRDGIPRSPMNPKRSEASAWSEARQIHHVLAPRAIGISSATWPFR